MNRSLACAGQHSDHSRGFQPSIWRWVTARSAGYNLVQEPWLTLLSFHDICEGAVRFSSLKRELLRVRGTTSTDGILPDPSAPRNQVQCLEHLEGR